MTLRFFSWACLLIAVIGVAWQLSDSASSEAFSLFTSTMILMSVGFSLVQRELAKLRAE